MEKCAVVSTCTPTPGAQAVFSLELWLRFDVLTLGSVHAESSLRLWYWRFKPFTF